MTEATIAWALALMTAAAPPGRTAHENADDGGGRYAAIARDVVAVAESEPPLFGGSRGRERTVALLLAVAYKESAFDRRVDVGEVRGAKGECGLWQIMPEGRSCGELVTDRRSGAREALRRMRRSQAACLRPGVPVELMLAAYASGRCDAGHEASRARVELAERWYRLRPPPAPEARR